MEKIDRWFSRLLEIERAVEREGWTKKYAEGSEESIAKYSANPRDYLMADSGCMTTQRLLESIFPEFSYVPIVRNCYIFCVDLELTQRLLSLRVSQYREEILKFQGNLLTWFTRIRELSAGVHLFLGKAFLAAIERKQLQIAQFFLNLGVDIRTQGQEALRISLRQETTETLEFLITKGINTFRDWQECFLDVIHQNRLDFVKTFVEAGVNVNLDGEPIKLAVWTENLEMVRFLVESGAEITQECLLIARRYKYKDIFLFLKGQSA